MLLHYPNISLKIQFLSHKYVIFNSHFISSGHLFEDSGLTKTVPVVDEHSCFKSCPLGEKLSFRQFSAKEVFDALVSINPKQLTRADLLNAKCLLLAAPIIALPLAHKNTLSPPLTLNGRQKSASATCHATPMS